MMAVHKVIVSCMNRLFLLRLVFLKEVFYDPKRFFHQLIRLINVHLVKGMCL